MAGDFFKEKILATDVSETILRMNNLRKDVSYGEPGSELATVDLEDIVSDPEKFIDEIETILDTLEQKSEEELAEDE